MGIEQSIEEIQQIGMLLSYDKSYKDIEKDLFEYKSNANRENQKLREMRLNVEKSFDILFYKDSKGLENFKKTYTSKDTETGKTKIDYNKFSKSLDNLIKNPQNYVKGLKKHEGVLKTISSQEFSKDIKKTLEVRKDYLKKFYDSKTRLVKQTEFNFKKAQSFKMIKDFSQYINSKEPYYTKLVKNYQNALTNLKEFKKENPKVLTKILNEKKLDERITKKHAIVQKLARETFKTQNKAQNKAQVKTK